MCDWVGVLSCVCFFWFVLLIVWFCGYLGSVWFMDLVGLEGWVDCWGYVS